MPTTQNEKVNQYYDSTVIAYRALWTGRKDLAMHFGYYDESVQTHQDSLLKMNSVLSGLAEISAEDHVLDAGCGYGGSSIWLARNTGCQVTGVTIVPYQIRKAEKYLRKYGPSEKVRFLCQDYSRTSLPDGSFSVVWGLESFVHAERKRDVIAEAWRLLDSGGRLLISEYMLMEGRIFSENEENIIRGWLKGWAMPNLLSPEEYKSILEERGFYGVEIHNLTENVRPSLRRLGKMAYILEPPFRLLYRLGLLSSVNMENIAASACQRRALEQGLWEYKVIVAKKP